MSKIDETKMKEAFRVLTEIVGLLQKYNGLLKKMTPQEKLLAGGIIFRIHNPWNNFQMVGMMADKELGNEMVNALIAFYQHPELFVGKDKSNLIISEDEDEKKREN